MYCENFDRRVGANIGDSGAKHMPYSEVCIHMRIAGKIMGFKIVSKTSVQLFDSEGKVFSFPIGTGEAGFFNGIDGSFYYYLPKLEETNA